jgi:hypothetical protein
MGAGRFHDRDIQGLSEKQSAGNFMGSERTGHLIHETSPYLLSTQSGRWYPARKLRKQKKKADPVSIGYSLTTGAM